MDNIPDIVRNLILLGFLRKLEEPDLNCGWFRMYHDVEERDNDIYTTRLMKVGSVRIDDVILNDQNYNLYLSGDLRPLFQTINNVYSFMKQHIQDNGWDHPNFKFGIKEFVFTPKIYDPETFDPVTGIIIRWAPKLIGTPDLFIGDKPKLDFKKPKKFKP